MIKKYTEKEARDLRMRLVSDNLFCIVFGELKNMKGSVTELNDVEIWTAAITLTTKITNCSAPEEIIDDFVADVRENVESENDVFLMLMVTICQLSALHKQIDNADDVIKLLLPYCREHELYNDLLSKWNSKEQSMMMMSKKVDLLTYALKEIGNVGEEKIVQYLGLFFDEAIKMPIESIKENLLVLNLINIKINHILDNKILDMYKVLSERSVQKPSWELILGNKNVSENGGMQYNGNIPFSTEQLKAILEHAKLTC